MAVWVPRRGRLGFGLLRQAESLAWHGPGVLLSIILFYILTQPDVAAMLLASHTSTLSDDTGCIALIAVSST